MNKLLLSALLACSFSALASDMNTLNDEEVNATAESGDLVGIAEGFLKKLKDHPVNRQSAQELRQAWLEGVRDRLPSCLPYAAVKAFAHDKTETMQVQGFSFMASKEDLKKQLSIRNLTVSNLELQDRTSDVKIQEEAINLIYRYRMLSLIYRDAYPVDLQVVVPSLDSFKEEMKPRLRASTEIFYQLGINLASLKHIQCEMNMGTFMTIKHTLDTRKESIKKNIEENKLEEVYAELELAYGNLKDSIENFINDLREESDEEGGSDQE